MPVRKSKCKHPLGANIKRVREALGMPQLVFAEKLGVKRERVSNWECEENNPSIECIPMIASVLNCSIDEIFGFVPFEDEQKRRLSLLLNDLDECDLETLIVAAESMRERHQPFGG